MCLASGLRAAALLPLWAAAVSPDRARAGGATLAVPSTLSQLLRTTGPREAARAAAAAAQAAAETAAAAAQNATSGSDAAESSGVVKNGADDLVIFLNALVFNGTLCLMFLLVFCVLRKLYPKIYANNCLSGAIPIDPGPGLFAWVGASWTVTTVTSHVDGAGNDIDHWIGLDSALLIEFCDLCIRILLLIAIPLWCIAAPLNRFVGPPVAGADFLTYFSFGNVEFGSWLYWVHAGIVWYIVVVAIACVFHAQSKFIERRMAWLHRLPELRANTILVEGLPEKQRSDEALKMFFAGMFGPQKIRSAYVIKNTWKLRAMRAQLGSLRHRLAEALVRHRLADPGTVEVAIEKLERQEIVAEKEIAAERAAVWEASRRPGDRGSNLYCGFVTFEERTDAELALSAHYSIDTREFRVLVPVEPADIRWRDLMQTPGGENCLKLIGCFLILCVYAAYLPLVVGITNIARLIVVPEVLEPIWSGLAPTAGLQVVVMMLPTALLWIFRKCFTLRSARFAQYDLQDAYFWFQVVYVIMVTAVGTDVVQFSITFFTQPLLVPKLLADTMPFATTFYMNYLLVQWVVVCGELTRRVQLLKYLGFRSLYTDEEARRKSEPEDQDYYGIGSRNARNSISLAIGIVYGTLCPPIVILALIHFFLCRLVYGYLVPFAEQRKADLGGIFWVSQLDHVFFSLAIYAVMMTGVFAVRAATWGPAMLTAPTVVFVAASHYYFKGHFSWEKLPFNEVANPPAPDAIGPKHSFHGTAYVQPELLEDDDQAKRHRGRINIYVPPSK